MASRPTLALEPSSAAFQAGVGLALELVTAALTEIGIEHDLDVPGRVRFANYGPIVNDLSTARDLTSDALQRLAAFVFGLGELVNVVALAYEDDKAAQFSRSEMAGVIVGAFRDAYHLDRAA